jgi:hypothetical protein
MKEKIPFNAYVDGAKRLMAEEVDSHVADTRIAYYGEMPDDIETVARVNHPAIEVQDDSGTSKYSVLISGNLLDAKTVLVKAMSWSDHPGRGFEALREALIADEDEKLAVAGVSFPGTVIASEPMTKKQRESLKKDDFSFIGAQQWKAALSAMRMELAPYLSDAQEVNEHIKDMDFVLGGSSQGATNAVGMFQSAPEGIDIKALGLAEEVGLEAQGWWKFRQNFVMGGSAHFKEYTAENPYNQYPDLGPDYPSPGGVGRVAVRRPASHLGSVIKGMRRGGDVQRILDTVREREIQDLAVTIATGTEDVVARYDVAQRAARVLAASDRIVASLVGWEGHHHPAMENLANAQHVFRGFTR